MAEGFIDVGTGKRVWATPDPPSLPSSEVLRVFTALDPFTREGSSRLYGVAHRLERARGGAQRSSLQERIDWLRSATVRADVEPPPLYDNPMRVSGQPDRRALSAGEFEFVRMHANEEPDKVSREDAKLLAQLEAIAEDEATACVVARTVDPIRAHHDRLEEQASLRQRLAHLQPVSSSMRTDKVFNYLLPVLEEAMEREARAELEQELSGASPEVRDRMLQSVGDEARRAAKVRLREAWASHDAEVDGQRSALMVRSHHLTRGAEPVDSSKPVAPSATFDEARRRGRAHREAREQQRHAFDAFPAVGGGNSSAA